MKSRMDLPGVYAIVHLKENNGTIVYVGSTHRTVRKRQTAHRGQLRSGKHKNQHLQRAWNKYGESTFIFLVLESVLSPILLTEREQYWLNQFRVNGTVYNVGTVAGSNRTGVCHRPDVIKRIRTASLGRRHSQESKDKISALLQGHPVSEETRHKISVALAGRPGHETTEETKLKISVAKKGKKFSAEHIRNLTIACRNRVMPPLSKEHKHSIGNSNARHYPAFVHCVTGEIILAGHNLSALCRERGLCQGSMSRVANGKRKSCSGWQLYKEARQ